MYGLSVIKYIYGNFNKTRNKHFAINRMPFKVTRQRRTVQLQLFQDTINLKLLLKIQPNSKQTFCLQKGCFREIKNKK